MPGTERLKTFGISWVKGVIQIICSKATTVGWLPRQLQDRRPVAGKNETWFKAWNFQPCTPVVKLLDPTGNTYITFKRMAVSRRASFNILSGNVWSCSPCLFILATVSLVNFNHSGECAPSGRSLIVVLISISLATNNIEDLFMEFWPWPIFFCKVFVQIFCPLFIGHLLLFIFLSFNCEFFIRSEYTSYLYQIYIVGIFFPIHGLPFYFLNSVLPRAKGLNFCEFQLIRYFSYYSSWFLCPMYLKYFAYLKTRNGFSHDFSFIALYLMILYLYKSLYISVYF